MWRRPSFISEGRDPPLLASTAQHRNRIEPGLRAEANITTDPLAQFVLGVASVEALTLEAAWTKGQLEVLAALEKAARDHPHVSTEEIEEIVERRRLSVGEGFRRLFQEIGLLHLWPR
jgi:hypothetical protein